MSDHTIVPMKGLPPAERAVRYILDVLPHFPELSYYLSNTEMLRLLCDAEANRLDIKPDITFTSGLFSSCFEAEYHKTLKPLAPRVFITCPQCGWESEESV